MTEKGNISGKLLGILGLILGIIALVLSLLMVAWWLGMVGAALSFMGLGQMTRSGGSKSLLTVALIVNLAAVAIGGYLTWKDTEPMPETEIELTEEEPEELDSMFDELEESMDEESSDSL